MIKIENGVVKFSGKGTDILLEYAIITNGIKKMFVENGGEEEKVKEHLRQSFEYGLMNEEELDKEIMEKSKKLDNMFQIVPILKEILKTIRDGEE